VNPIRFVLALALAGSASPTPLLTPNPRMGFSPLRVHLVAELKGGEESEKWYCPGVEWTWPDGTHSSEESDCPEWDKRDDYFPRRWSKDVVFPEGEWPVTVEWSKAGRLLARAETKVSVLGGGQ
jgi:hypothetical protein